jgi:hypothetical protein
MVGNVLKRVLRPVGTLEYKKASPRTFPNNSNISGILLLYFIIPATHQLRRRCRIYIVAYA